MPVASCPYRVAELAPKAAFRPPETLETRAIPPPCAAGKKNTQVSPPPPPLNPASVARYSNGPSGRSEESRLEYSGGNQGQLAEKETGVRVGRMFGGGRVGEGKGRRKPANAVLMGLDDGEGGPIGLGLFVRRLHDNTAAAALLGRVWVFALVDLEGAMC